MMLVDRSGGGVAIDDQEHVMKSHVIPVDKASDIRRLYCEDVGINETPASPRVQTSDLAVLLARSESARCTIILPAF